MNLYRTLVLSAVSVALPLACVACGGSGVDVMSSASKRAKNSRKGAVAGSGASTLRALPADPEPNLTRAQELISDLDAIRTRVIAMQTWLARNRESQHVEATRQRIRHYMYVYLMPDKWCSTPARCKNLNAQRKASYERFLQTQAGSPWETPVTAALAELRAPPASPSLAKARIGVDGAYDEVAKRMMAWYSARNDKARQSAIGEAHKAWLSGHHKRFEATVATLGPAEQKRLRAYRRARLVPALGRMDYLLKKR